MDKIQQEITDNYKWALSNWMDILLTLDAETPLNEQVYTEKQVAEATYLFTHVLSNYVIGKMVEQWCSKEYMKKHMCASWSDLRELLLEYAKIDSFTFPYMND